MRSTQLIRHVLGTDRSVAESTTQQSATPQQMSEAVKRELSQVESMIRTACFKRQSDRRSSKPQTGPYSPQTRAALKLLRETTQPSALTMATASATTPDGNSVAKSTLKSLQQDPVV